MAGRRRLSYPQTQALTALGEHRAKMLGHKAEFEARKAAEYAAEFNELEQQEAQLVASLLDLDTPKIRIAEVMGTKNYGNLSTLDAAAQQYRKHPDPVKEKPAPVENDSRLAGEIARVLDHLDEFTRENETTANEYGEWEEEWYLDGTTLTFLCWEPDGVNLLTVEGPSYEAVAALETNDNYEKIVEGIYGHR